MIHLKRFKIFNESINEVDPYGEETWEEEMDDLGSILNRLEKGLITKDRAEFLIKCLDIRKKNMERQEHCDHVWYKNPPSNWYENGIKGCVKCGKRVEYAINDDEYDFWSSRN